MASGFKHNSFPAILIGQFGRADGFKDDISGERLMYECCKHIYKGQERLGGKFLILECKNNPNLIAFYNSCGFDILENPQSSGLITMLKSLV